MESELKPGEKGFGIVIFLLSAFILFNAYSISGFSSVTSPGVFPMFAGSLMLISSLVIIIKNAMQKGSIRKPFAESFKIACNYILTPQIIIFSGIIVLYMVLLVPLGFLLSSFLFLTGSMLYFRGIKFIKKALVISGGMLVIIYIIFDFLFRLILP